MPRLNDSATAAVPTPPLYRSGRAGTTATVEHEASTSKIGEDQIFYCNQRGIPTEDAVNMIFSGYCQACPERSQWVFRELPMELAVETQKLLVVSLEGSVG